MIPAIVPHFVIIFLIYLVVQNSNFVILNVLPNLKNDKINKKIYFQQKNNYFHT